MTRINELLEAVCSELKGLFPELRTCEVHDGKFDLEELKRVSKKAPGMLAAVLGVTRTTDPGTEQTDAELQMAVFVIAKDEPALRRGAAARNLVEALLVNVPRARWGLEGVGSGDDVRAQNFYSGQIDRHGVALWAVSWKQVIRLGDSVFDEDGTLPSTLYVAFNGGEHEELTDG